VILTRDGVRFGFLQRSSVYWPTNHEAGEVSTGIAVIRGHTAYHVPMHGSRPPANRPGIPPEIVTWADPVYLKRLDDDIAALRGRAEVVVTSFHWGLHQEVLRYMTDIAHRAIDAGADLVIGHGPHYSLPIEVYKGVPIFYGLGSFSGHGGRQHGDWLGMMARVSWERRKIADAAFQFVRHDRYNRTVLRAPADEGVEFDEIVQRSAGLGARLAVRGDEVEIDLRT
jgi:Bacterial capsule synthesis protein PGA_cap